MAYLQQHDLCARLDLEKPVEREIVEECLDIALQAPTGSNTKGGSGFYN